MKVIRTTLVSSSLGRVLCLYNIYRAPWCITGCGTLTALWQLLPECAAHTVESRKVLRVLFLLRQMMQPIKNLPCSLLPHTELSWFISQEKPFVCFWYQSSWEPCWDKSPWLTALCCLIQSSHQVAAFGNWNSSWNFISREVLTGNVLLEWCSKKKKQTRQKFFLLRIIFQNKFKCSNIYSYFL